MKDGVDLADARGPVGRVPEIGGDDVAGKAAQVLEGAGGEIVERDDLPAARGVEEG